MRQGHAARPVRSDDPQRRRDLHLSGADPGREGGARASVKVASVATGFPSGQTFRDIKLAETRQAVDAGADEIDMVIDRGAFLSGDYAKVFDEIVAVKAAAGARTSR